MDSFLVTGAAGFIGFHTCKWLLDHGYHVVGIDNINDYYDVNLKLDRLKQLEPYSFEFHKIDITHRDNVEKLFKQYRFNKVIHLAAQAGVRHSISNPYEYINSNIVGFLNVLEGCRNCSVEHLLYASSSSVYGSNTVMPFSVDHNVDHPISLYAATKKSNELMAHTYSHLYKLPTTGLRFFTVYGPWGRPDMAAFIFTKAIVEERPVEMFNYGKMKRDFTYIDDIVEGIVKLVNKIPERNDSLDLTPAVSTAPYRVYNIGNNNPVELSYFVECIEKSLGKKAIKKLMPMQDGDVPVSWADIDDLYKDIGFLPKISIEVGIAKFVEWYKSYNGIL